MDSTRIMSILVIIFMVGSMAGVALLMGEAPEEEKPYEQPPGDLLPPQDQPPIDEIIAYQSEPFDANVTEVFPSLTVTAQTSETEINLIDSQIYGVQGVTRVDSQFSIEGQTQITSGISYLAEVSFQPGLDNEEMAEAIRQKADKLYSLEIFSSALLRIPATLELKGMDDANKTKTYAFEEPFTQGYINMGTRKGDTISIIEQAVFNGEQLIQSLAFEVENITGKLAQLTLTQEAEVEGLRAQARLAGEVPYAGQDFNALEAELQAVAGVQNLKLEPMLTGGFIEFNFDGNVPEETLADLNTEFNQLAGVTQTMFNAVPLMFYLGFDKDTDYAALKQNINSVLAEKEVNAELIDPNVFLSADLNTASTNLSALSETILGIMVREKADVTGFYQKGLIKLGSPKIEDPETGEVYWTDQNQTVFDAWLKTGHDSKEIVNVELRVTGERGKVLELLAIEPWE